MSEPTENENKLFDHYRNSCQDRLTAEVDAFDTAFADLKYLMGEVAHGGGADSIAVAVNNIRICRGEVLETVTNVTDLVLLEENGVFEHDEGVTFWVGFVHSYESDLVRWAYALTDGKLDESAAASSRMQLDRQARAYAGLITTAEVDPVDRDYIDLDTFEGANDPDDADVDDTDWVVMLRDMRMADIIDVFLEHVPPNKAETRQNRREYLRLIARGVLQTAAYSSVPIVLSRLITRKRNK